MVLGQPSGRPTGAITIEFEAARKWTNVWNVSMEATPTGFHGGSVRLKTEEGAFMVPLATLADEDITYLKSTLKKLGKESYFPGCVAPNGTEKLRQHPSKWKQAISQWASIVRKDDPQVSNAAWNHIRNINDPNALEMLLKNLADEEHPSLQIAFVEAIASMKADEATRELVRLSIADERYPVANAAAWLIKSIGGTDAIFDEFARLLKTNRHQDRAMLSIFASDIANPEQSRKASNYRRHSGFTKSLISILTVQQSKPGWIGAWRGNWTFYPGGSAGYLKIKTQAIRVFFEVPHPTALQLLKKYTGKDFGYRKRDWYRWQNNTEENALPGS